MEYGSNSPSQKKSFAISVTIHAILIIMVIFLSGHYVRRPPQLMTISLENEKLPPPRPDKSGGDGRKAGSEGSDKKAAKGALKTVIKRAARPASERSQNIAYPSEADLKSKAVTRTDVKPDTVPTPLESAENTALRGVGEGSGGGGGRGLGAYGSGSGFGGTGKDGMGGGTGRGTGILHKADVERYLAEHYKYIKDLIQRHIVYPPLAKKMGWEGKVKVSFTISEKGLAQRLKVQSSSGYRALDDNLMETIREVQPFPKPPAPADLDISITYSLDKM